MIVTIDFPEMSRFLGLEAEVTRSEMKSLTFSMVCLAAAWGRPTTVHKCVRSCENKSSSLCECGSVRWYSVSWFSILKLSFPDIFYITLKSVLTPDCLTSFLMVMFFGLMFACEHPRWRNSLTSKKINLRRQYSA